MPTKLLVPAKPLPNTFRLLIEIMRLKLVSWRLERLAKRRKDK
jgi:hypothetical protein